MHQPDDPKTIILIDVNPYKQGILGPKEFLEKFGHLRIAECKSDSVYIPELIELIKTTTFGSQSYYKIRNEIPEGVVCKGGSGHNLWMAKIKTNNYLNKLKEVYQNDWSKYWE